MAKTPIQIFLMRHGDALPSHQDPQRPLSPFGEEQAQKIHGLLAEASFQPQRLLHSPKARARQTARAIAAAFREPLPPEETAGLLPEDPVSPWIHRLEESPGTLLVGHNPFLSELATRLTGSPQGLSTATFLALEAQPSGTYRVLARLEA